MTINELINVLQSNAMIFGGDKEVRITEGFGNNLNIRAIWVSGNQNQNEHLEIFNGI